MPSFKQLKPSRSRRSTVPRGPLTPDDIRLNLKKNFLRRLYIFAIKIFVLFASASFAYAFSEKDSAFSVLAACALTAASAGAVGGFFGFLFGLPKSRRTDQNGEVDGTQRSERYRSNTNLEEVSDWLTKILVGLGLVQLGAVSGHISRLGNALMPMYRNTPAGAAFAVAICIYSAISGFLVMYMWVRAYFKNILEMSDAVLWDKFKNQFEADPKDVYASTLATNALNDIGSPRSEADLAVAINNSSEQCREQIYNDAEVRRANHWLHPNKDGIQRAEHDRTVPVFRALAINSDNFRYHGSLGYALKDSISPDYRAAEQELTRAIELRPASELDYRLYEWNRALCRILIDKDTPPPPGARQARQEEILHDLKAFREESNDLAWFDPRSADFGRRTVGEWIEANGVKLGE